VMGQPRGSREAAGPSLHQVVDDLGNPLPGLCVLHRT
jgi:hypothetical protein